MDRYASRRNKLRRRLKSAGADALLVTDFTNVTYLTGFTGDDSYLLIMRSGEVLITDSRYETQLAEECPALDVHVRGREATMASAVTRLVRKAKIGHLAIEADAMTVALFAELEAGLPKTELVSSSGLVEDLREAKDAGEIKAIRRAVRQAEQAFAELRAKVAGGGTEKQLADELEMAIRRHGGAASSFPPIVAAGPHAALPHARPTTQRIEGAAMLLVDWGACEGLYKSDLTRILVTAKISSKLERMYRVVFKAQRRAIASIRPGVPASRVDRVAREVIANEGFGRYFGHGLGHGIGLDIHERPRLGQSNGRPLKPGMVVTVEPGIYLPGWGGVRIEDDVLVTRDGHEVLSTLTAELDAMVVC